MIVSFGNRMARELWETQQTKGLPLDLERRALQLLTIMARFDTVRQLRSLGEPPTLRFHKLKGARRDEYSITIKLPFCITFKYKGGKYHEVKIENYHKG